MKKRPKSPRGRLRSPRGGVHSRKRVNDSAGSIKGLRSPPRSPRGIKGAHRGSKQTFKAAVDAASPSELETMYVYDHWKVNEMCPDLPCTTYAASVVAMYKMRTRDNVLLYCVQLQLVDRHPLYALLSEREIKELRRRLAHFFQSVGLSFPEVKLEGHGGKKHRYDGKQSQIRAIEKFFAFLVQNEVIQSSGCPIYTDFLRSSLSRNNFTLEVRILSVDPALLYTTAQVHSANVLSDSGLSLDVQARLGRDPVFEKISQRLACCKGIPPNDETLFQWVMQEQLHPLLQKQKDEAKDSRCLNLISVIGDHLKESGLPADTQSEILAAIDLNQPLQVVLLSMNSLIEKANQQAEASDIRGSLEAVVDRSNLSPLKKAMLLKSEKYNLLVKKALLPQTDPQKIVGRLMKLIKQAPTTDMKARESARHVAGVTELDASEYFYVDDDDTRDLLCAICFCVCVDPVQSADGCKLMCKSCVGQGIQVGESPEDIRRACNSLEVFCLSAALGCFWSGPRETLLHHLSHECSFKLGTCEHCKTKVVLDTHTAEDCESNFIIAFQKKLELKADAQVDDEFDVDEEIANSSSSGSNSGEDSWESEEDSWEYEWEEGEEEEEEEFSLSEDTGFQSEF